MYGLFTDHYESHLFRHVYPLIKSGSVVIDVGAHIGIHTVHLANLKQVKKVIAIEPHPTNLKLLLLNIKLNNLTNVIVIPAAAWKSSGMITLFTSYTSGEHSVKYKPLIPKEKVIVKAIRLEELIEKFNLQDPILVKIDVEGAEREVIMGLGKCIDASSIYLMVVEVWEKNRGEVFKLLMKYEPSRLTEYGERADYLFIKSQTT